MDSFAYVKHLAALPAVRRQGIERLVRSAFWEDFGDRQAVDADQDFSRLLSLVVEVVTDCPDDVTAFVTLRDLGVDVSFQTFDALDSLYGGYNDTLARMLAATLAEEGRPLPVGETRRVRTPYARGLGAHLPWLEGSGRCLFVPLDEVGWPVYEFEGDLVANIVAWHDLVGIGETHRLSPAELDAGLPGAARDEFRGILSLHATSARLERIRRDQGPGNPVWEAEIREVTPAQGVVRVAAPRIAAMMAGLSELRRGFSGSDAAKARQSLATLKSEMDKLEGLVRALS